MNIEPHHNQKRHDDENNNLIEKRKRASKADTALPSANRGQGWCQVLGQTSIAWGHARTLMREV